MSSDQKTKALSGITKVSKTLWTDNEIVRMDDHAAEETPIALEYNCVSHAVMMATSADIADFAVGFSISEGVVKSIDEILDIEVVDAQEQHGKVVSMIISAERLEALKKRRRSLVGRTGCGICGAETIEQAMQLVHSTIKKTDSAIVVSHQAIQQALASLEERQELNQATGAIHAAAWCDESGQIQYLREDVGRHNALDKLIGAIANHASATEFYPERGFVLISSRASFEMVSKTLALGSSILVAVSGVTQLAVETAHNANLTLVGFSRPGRHSIYTYPDRLIQNALADLSALMPTDQSRAFIRSASSRCLVCLQK